MDYAFWDSSALVPLCLQQEATPQAQLLSTQYRITVWWATSIEMRGAFARLLRVGQLSPNGQVVAQVELEHFRNAWREIEPTERLREQAERLVDRFPLKAADAQQLAAALAWCSGRPRLRAFISGDAQLLEAAAQLGFRTLTV
jgi:uncharacterized protein